MSIQGTPGASALDALHLSEILPAVDGLLFLLSRDGEILDFRAGAEGELLVPPGRFLGRRLRDVVPAESVDAIDAAFDAAFDTAFGTATENGSARVAYTLPMPGGARAYEAQIIPLAGDRSLAIVRQVSDRARIEAELFGNASRLRAILEATPECVKVVSRDGRLKEMNPAGLSMLEVPELASAQGSSLVDFVAPEHRPSFVEMARRVFQGESANLTFELIGREGTRRWVESSAVPLRDASGRVESLLAVTRDVTARRRAEAAMRESERRLTEAVRAYGIGIFDHDHTTAQSYYSPELRRMRDWPLNTPIAPADDLAGIHADDRARVTEAVARAHAPDGDGHMDVEYRVVRPDGAIRWLRARSHTTFEGHGA
ncbi:MAG TPA: PAS domain-containing protein, partial [Gemmatimonadaceae bacterium]|nr:PAS domain-containing protein [Gemmatimonadaceae bacterium]